jgi:NAD(P)-dependent dehydrogenase (short-subunit alcohol dehydrogenase family)
MLAEIPMKRFGKPEVANAVAFLASPAAAYMLVLNHSGWWAAECFEPISFVLFVASINN